MRSFAEALTEKGFPISHSVISQMENGGRRIDIDELVILSNALQVSPVALLTPHTENPDEVVGNSISPNATARGVVMGLYKLDPDLPKWTRDTITDVSGTDQENMIRAAKQIRAIEEVLETDDIEMLLAIATGTFPFSTVRMYKDQEEVTEDTIRKIKADDGDDSHVRD